MYLSIRRAVESCSVSQATLQRWIDNGDVPVVKVGGRILIDTKDLRAFLDSHKETRTPKPKNDDGADATAPSVRTPGAETAGHGPG